MLPYPYRENSPSSADLVARIDLKGGTAIEINKNFVIGATPPDLAAALSLSKLEDIRLYSERFGILKPSVSEDFRVLKPSDPSAHIDWCEEGSDKAKVTTDRRGKILYVEGAAERSQEEDMRSLAA